MSYSEGKPGYCSENREIWCKLAEIRKWHAKCDVIFKRAAKTEYFRLKLMEVSEIILVKYAENIHSLIRETYLVPWHAMSGRSSIDLMCTDGYPS